MHGALSRIELECEPRVLLQGPLHWPVWLLGSSLEALLLQQQGQAVAVDNCRLKSVFVFKLPLKSGLMAVVSFCPFDMTTA